MDKETFLYIQGQRPDCKLFNEEALARAYEAGRAGADKWHKPSIRPVDESLVLVYTRSTDFFICSYDSNDDKYHDIFKGDVIDDVIVGWKPIKEPVNVRDFYDD